LGEGGARGLAGEAGGPSQRKALALFLFLTEKPSKNWGVEEDKYFIFFGGEGGREERWGSVFGSALNLFEIEALGGGLWDYDVFRHLGLSVGCLLTSSILKHSNNSWLVLESYLFS
jgi:hypothetical protein